MVWVIVFLQLPKPMWVYVVGHELTHALWTWLFGGRVKRLRATCEGRICGDHPQQFSHHFGPVFLSTVRFDVDGRL
jgi:hypothetical protein